MALQIANPNVTRKVDELARSTGLSKTAVVERAIDRLAGESGTGGDLPARIDALLRQIDRIPDRGDAFDATPWDEHGLPR